MHHGDVSPEIAAGLLALKERIKAADIPPSKLDESINVAIWNIREFGKKRRSDAAIHYIAEILGQFDLIALVELRDKLERLSAASARSSGRAGIWSIPTGCPIPAATASASAYLFDRRAVTFNGLAAEIDPPRAKKGTEYLAQQVVLAGALHVLLPRRQLRFHRARHPCALGRQPGRPRRPSSACWPTGSTCASRTSAVEDNDLIVMGDFNTPSLDDKIFKALTRRGLQIPDVAGRPQDRRHHGRKAPTSARTRATTRSCTCRRSRSASPTTAARSTSTSPTPSSRSCSPTPAIRAGVHLPALRPLPDLGADRHRHRRPAADADRPEHQEVIGTPPGPREETTCNCG